MVSYRAIKIESESPQIKFLILEEDLGDNAITLKSLYDTIKMPQNNLLAVYFSERMFLYQFILQTLKGITHLNLNGKTFGELHGDISPVSITVIMNPQFNSFRVKILDFLKIRDLVEIAQQGTTSERSSRLAKPLPYDAPEKMYVN